MTLIVFRFVKGWLEVQFYGNNVPRFINLCTRHGIQLWNVKTIDYNCIQARLYVKHFFELRPMIRKTRVRTRILSRHGLPFFIRRYRRRKVFISVIFCVIVGILILSTRIWRIEIDGNSSLSEETILHYLADQSISYGTSRFQIDNDALELSLRQDFDSVIWASVYEKGTKLVVSIQEKLATDKMNTDTNDGATDLVATKDALIDSIITRKGIGVVKAGDHVEKGDLLISGRQEILDDNGEVKEYYYENADADVIGRTTYSYEDWIEENIVERDKTGAVNTRYFIQFGEYRFTTPSLHADYDLASTMEQNRQFCLMENFYLPVYYGTMKEYEEICTPKTLTTEEAKENAILHLNQFLTNLEQNGVSIIDKNVMIEKIDQKYHVYGNVTAKESITTQQPTRILQQPEKESTEAE